MLTHGSSLHNLTRFPGFAARPCRRFVSWLPFFHDLGLFMGMLHPLSQGCLSVLMPPLAFAQRPLRWLEALSRYGGTTTGGPNFAYDLCVRRSSPEERAGLDLSAWNLALNGSEPVRAATLERFGAAFAPAGFRPEAFYASYGLAEASATVTGASTMAPPVLFSASRRAAGQGEVVAAGRDEETAQLLVGCGPVIDDQTLRVVDPGTRLACPPGRIGEIWVSGPSIAKGYWNRPEETASQLLARLADTGEGPFLRTGDLGFVREDGELFLSGRLKDLLILRGVNHHPEDIEATVERSVRGARPSCGAAFAVEDGGEERLALVWEADAQGDGELERILWDLRQAVARVHEIEAWAIVLIAPKALPKTSSGKIQRQLCREMFLAGRFQPLASWRLPAAAAPDPEPAAPARAAVAPAAIRERLVAHFAHRLGVPPEAIDPGETFDRFGLASVEAVDLVNGLAQWLGLPLPPTLAWSFPSIEALAAHLARLTGWAGGAPAPAVEAAEPAGEPIAIVGMGCRFPGAPGLEAFWNLLATGADAVGEVPADRWDAAAFWSPDPAAPGKMVSRQGGFLPGLDLFDAEFFGITPREAAHLDPRQRLLLESTWEALEDAGIAPRTLRGSRTGVFVATLADEYESLVGVEQIDAYMGPGTSDTVVANRLSYFFDLAGPSVTVNTACSGSLVAVHLACQSLRGGESALAIAGGVNVILLPKGNVFFSKAGALSPTGRCRTFDSRADGIVRSDGAGVVVLKPLSRALADGDPIHAVIRGSAVNSDGRSSGIMAPSGRAQEALLREAYRRAGVAPARVQYVEAHGTGTRVGDPIEAQALGAVLGAGRPAERPCRLGSLKTNVGHMEAASGIGGILKVALSMRRRTLPPSLHFREPNPLIAFTEL
ncbi:MAG TPA: beta-ketoacyl synthase N-terminal-like domain-containing protein, partial [Thermoanaerobaculia bacterium]|nr:beta-ketoacyl synthase N-terminal-like domain-containing protein [Thermoanaerobaculia bacterium]